MATAMALPRTIPILHAPPGCAGNLAWTQAGGAGLQVGGYCGGLSMPGSNVQEREVVFGGTDRLEELVKNSLKIMAGDLYIILTSCVTEMIGDDVASVVNSLAEDDGEKIIYAETGGFHGNSYLGYDLVLESILAQYVPVTGKKTGRVNLWGIPPYFDVFWRGNLLELRRLLEKIGLEVNTFFTVEDTLASIRQAGSAELNIVVSDIFGLKAAETAKNIHGTPYLTTQLPIGPTATADFLGTVGAALNLPQEVIARFIDDQTRRYYSILEPLTDCFSDIDLQRYAAVVGDSNYVTAVTRFLADDLGWLPEVAAVTDVLRDEQKDLVAERLNKLESGIRPELIFSTDTSEIRRQTLSHWQSRTKIQGKYTHSPNPAFVLGSSLERELAKELNAPHLSIAFPVSNRAVLDRGYAGFSGGLRLIEDLLSTIIVNR
jgi:nitrogenase molybdenum-iron protein beta chain